MKKTIFSMMLTLSCSQVWGIENETSSEEISSSQDKKGNFMSQLLPSNEQISKVPYYGFYLGSGTLGMASLSKHMYAFSFGKTGVQNLPKSIKYLPSTTLPVSFGIFAGSFVMSHWYEGKDILVSPMVAKISHSLNQPLDSDMDDIFWHD